MKTSKYHLSIIVPAYNAEDTINDCVESILNQTFADFELILVDDGSTDTTAAICDEYALKDNRVSVVHIKNSGIFQARKVGIEKAKGDIITFSDADDWLECDAFEMAMQIFNQYDPDIFTYAYIYENIIEKHIYEEKLYCKKEIRDIIIPGMMFDVVIGKRRLNPHMGCKYIKKALLKKVTDSVIDRISLGEDALITYSAFCMAQSVFISNKAFYHYENNISSFMHTFPLERITELKAFQKNIIKIFDKLDMRLEMEVQVENYIRTFLNEMIHHWYGIELSATLFRFPYEVIPKGTRIFIYGAGNVGKSYVNELLQGKYAALMGIADKNYQKIHFLYGIEVIDPRLIKDKLFDIILIAMLDEKIAQVIKGDLIASGIPDNKIVWVKPQHIYN